MRTPTPRTVLLIALLLAPSLLPTLGVAQDFGFDPPAQAADPELPAAMRDLAERLLPAYQEDDPDRYFSTLAALQMAAGDPAAAHTTRLTLQERLQSEPSSLPPGRVVVYDIYTRARAIEATDGLSFASAYARAFEETMSSLDDLAAYELEDWLLAPTEPLQGALERMLDRRRGTSSVTLEEALDLVQAWFAFDAYRSFSGLVRPLLAEDKGRRYVAEEVAIPVAANATVAAALVRPRSAAAGDPLPTLLEFTLDRESRDPYEAAAHGFGSVLALSRIAGDPLFRPRAPFESEADDAWAAIAWIAQQPWSDGRVGMQGSRYGGFVAWAAAKRRPPALFAIATSDPMAPGIDVPTRGRISHSSAYRWVYELLAPPAEERADDDARWRALYEDWYRSGRSYRELPSLPGRGSAVFRSWLNHPSYDRYWQKWAPSDAELAGLEIPILTVTGYYSAGQAAALHYFTRHRQHNANAQHALLIGPYSEHTVEGGVRAELRGLSLDPAARIEPNAVRYSWFAHVLRGAAAPALLQADLNYELVGANEWRHEPSLAALEGTVRRLYLEASSSDGPHGLIAEEPTAAMSLTTSVDFRDRTDAAWRPPEPLVGRDVELRNAVAFVTEPFDEATDVAGRLRGELDFTINKYDVDLVLMLYEMRANGEFVQLFDPPFAFRASYARDRVRRRLLVAGARQQLTFQSDRMMGARLEAGSRLMLTLGINKRADQQLNYGAAGEVSEESIADAGAPMRIRWHEGSFVDVPLRQ